MVLHLLAVTATALASIALLPKLLIGLAVIISLGFNLRDSLAKKQLIWRAGNNWAIELQENHYRVAKLTAINFLSRWLVIISLKAENQRPEKFIIPFDAVNANSFRLLRVRLRIEGHQLINPDEEG